MYAYLSHNLQMHFLLIFDVFSTIHQRCNHGYHFGDYVSFHRAHHVSDDENESSLLL